MRKFVAFDSKISHTDSGMRETVNHDEWQHVKELLSEALEHGNADEADVMDRNGLTPAERDELESLLSLRTVANRFI
jgi:hypothetical protein